MKKRIHQIITISKHPGDASWYFDIFIITLILLNVFAILLESVEPIRLQYKGLFDYFEIFSVVIFTVEYLLRLWTANVNPKCRKPGVGNLKFALTPLALIDFLAILPFYLPFIGIDLRLIRILRMFRLFRIFKIARYMRALMYHVEHDAQPQHFSSIPETMWWGIATLTTVGYGDMYPITPLGKLLGGAIAIIGIGLFALPTGILGSGFSEELSRRKKKLAGECATCGQKMHD